MAEEKLFKINDDDKKIIEKIEELLGIELKQVAEIQWDTRGYVVSEDGQVSGLGLYQGLKYSENFLQTVCFNGFAEEPDDVGFTAIISLAIFPDWQN